MPGRGQYWKVGGINDEHIKEEDLTQALQTKVNSGGGGGTGFPDTVPETEIIYYDDFLNYNANFSTNIADRNFIATTSGNISDTGLPNGIVDFSTGAGAGSRIFMSTSDAFGFFDSGHRNDGSARWACSNATTANRMMFVGWNEVDSVGVDTTVANTFETALGNGAWFRFDPQNDANWQAVVQKTGAGKTVIDTGVAPSGNDLPLPNSAFETLRVLLQPDSAGSETGTTTWFIDGNQVAQTTDNFPVGTDIIDDGFARLTFFASTTTLEAISKNSVLDWWYLLCERKLQPFIGD